MRAGELALATAGRAEQGLRAANRLCQDCATFKQTFKEMRASGSLFMPLPVRHQALLAVPARMTVAIPGPGVPRRIGGPIQGYAGQAPPAAERRR